MFFKSKRSFYILGLIYLFGCSSQELELTTQSSVTNQLDQDINAKLTILYTTPVESDADYDLGEENDILKVIPEEGSGPSEGGDGAGGDSAGGDDGTGDSSERDRDGGSENEDRDRQEQDEQDEQEVVIDGTTELPSCEELFAYAAALGYDEAFIEGINQIAYERYPELEGASVSQVINMVTKLYPNIEKVLLYKIVNCLIEDTPPTSDGCTAARPEDLVSSDITDTSAVLNWSDVQEVYSVTIDHYNVRYRPEGTTAWEYVRSIEPTETSVEVTGLQSATSYEWQVRSKCADFSVGSDYKNYTGYFTTLGMDEDQPIPEIETQLMPDDTIENTEESELEQEEEEVVEEPQDAADEMDNQNPSVSDLDVISQFGLSTTVAPSVNFDLANWSLETDGVIVETAGLVDYKDGAFFTDTDNGGMVFTNCTDGVGSAELRYMIDPTLLEDYEVPSNNFYISTSSSDTLAQAGAEGGSLKATVTIDSVTENASNCETSGSVIIAQVNSSENTMLSLYYHKLPNHDLGSLYFIHQPNCGDTQWVNLVGTLVSTSGYDNVCEASQPLNGIGLGDAFTYHIRVLNESLIVSVTWGEGQLTSQGLSATKNIDIANSCYEDDYLYFTAGISSPNGAGSCDQVTVYDLETSY